MFNNVKIAACHLPDAFKHLAEEEWQTKDGDARYANMLELFEINEDGRLLFHEVKYDWVEGDGFFGGHLEPRETKIIDTEFHGYFNFYTNVAAQSWVELRAKFTDGKLQNVICIEGA